MISKDKEENIYYNQTQNYFVSCPGALIFLNFPSMNQLTKQDTVYMTYSILAFDLTNREKWLHFRLLLWYMFRYPTPKPHAIIDSAKFSFCDWFVIWGLHCWCECSTCPGMESAYNVMAAWRRCIFCLFLLQACCLPPQWTAASQPCQYALEPPTY